MPRLFIGAVVGGVALIDDRPACRRNDVRAAAGMMEPPHRDEHPADYRQGRSARNADSEVVLVDEVLTTVLPTSTSTSGVVDGLAHVEIVVRRGEIIDVPADGVSGNPQS